MVLQIQLLSQMKQRTHLTRILSLSLSRTYTHTHAHTHTLPKRSNQVRGSHNTHLNDLSVSPLSLPYNLGSLLNHSKSQVSSTPDGENKLYQRTVGRIKGCAVWWSFSSLRSEAPGDVAAQTCATDDVSSFHQIIKSWLEPQSIKKFFRFVKTLKKSLNLYMIWGITISTNFSALGSW